MSSFTAREKRLGLRNKKSQQNICFTWEWRPLNARQFNNEELDKSLNLPVVQVFLYEAKNVYDDRFDMHPSTTRKASRQTRKPDEIKTVNLTLAQTWSYLCDENGRTTFGHCIKSAFVGRTLLSEGTYVYLYSVDGKLQLGQEDEKTCLGSKREVHYIDVREQRREDTFDQDMKYLESLPVIQPKRRSPEASTDVVSPEAVRSFMSLREWYRHSSARHPNKIIPMERYLWNQIFKRMSGKMTH